MAAKNIYERFIWFEDQVKLKRYPNATLLSRRFETSVKTAQRDIEFMRDRLDCPLVYDSNRKGYYYEDDTFSLPLVHLTAEELSALVIARRLLLDVAGSPIAGEITSAVDKITSIIRRHVAADTPVEDVVSFHHVEHAPASPAVFRAVLEACLKKRSLAIEYHSPRHPDRTNRVVDPYHLLNYMGTWHLIAFCRLRNDLRDFNLSRIASAQLQDSTFTVRPSFRFEEFFGSAFGIYRGGEVQEVTLRFSPEKARWVKGQVWHKDQSSRMLKDGSLEMSFPVADFSEVVMEVLRHGSGVEVIRPERLRELIKKEALNIAGLY